jgi:exodeoxyribonuclease VII large subunit
MPELPFEPGPEAPEDGFATGLPARDVYTVSRLNAEARLLLESSFPLLWIEGEISNLARPGSGHWYFSLKDDRAQVRCAMFRNRNQYLRLTPRDGMQVMLRGRVSLYEGRGEFQIIAEHMEEAGDGALRRAFEALKARLGAEGLFDPQLKRPLPRLPGRIGVVTSPTGAALRDVLSVLRRRFPAIPVLVFPVGVQGAGAAEEIAAALDKAGAMGACDVLLLVRGGGSLEDLWAFNEEIVARAIRRSPVPVVVGVGHETDFTIADMAADARAPTPSVAAETVSPDAGAWIREYAAHERKLEHQMGAALQRQWQRLDWLDKRLHQQHPERRLAQQSERLEGLRRRMAAAQRAHIQDLAIGLERQWARLQGHSPQRRLEDLKLRRMRAGERLVAAMRQHLTRSGHALASVARSLETVSPLATLARGYSVLTDAEGKRIIRSSDEVGVGDPVRARLHEGALDLRVERKD